MSKEWRSGVIHKEEHATTLVTFTLEEVAEGTRLRVVESGFASLPEAFQAQSHQDNLGGWQSELPKLRVYLQSTISAP